MTEKWEEELLEALSCLEHRRWSRWQEYLHSKCIKNTDGSLTIPSEYVDHLDELINTEYFLLSEKSKDSDRKEAEENIRLIIPVISEARKDAVISYDKTLNIKELCQYCDYFCRGSDEEIGNKLQDERAEALKKYGIEEK